MKTYKCSFTYKWNDDSVKKHRFEVNAFSDEEASKQAKAYQIKFINTLLNHKVDKNKKLEVELIIDSDLKEDGQSGTYLDVRCGECGKKKVFLENAKGRQFSYKDTKEITLLVDLLLPICNNCGNILSRAGDNKKIDGAIKKSLLLSKKYTVGELKEWLSRYPDTAYIRMCMDWTELDECPDHLQQQWDDDLGSIAFDGKDVILLNKHFK